MKYYQFITLISDIEFLVNDRPLTYIENNHNFEILTPNDFLINKNGQKQMELENNIGSDEYNEKNNRLGLIENWKKLQKLKTKFIKLWKYSYLQNLKERYVYTHKIKGKTSLKNPKKGKLY